MITGSTETKLKDNLIIEAAHSCISRYGLSKTRMRDIASAAQISRKTLYLYFESKDALVISVIKYELEQIAEQAYAATRSCAELENLIVGLTTSIFTLLCQSSIARAAARENLPLLLQVIPIEIERILLRLLTDKFYTQRDLGRIRASIELQRLAEWLVITIYGYIFRPQEHHVSASHAAASFGSALRCFILPAIFCDNPGADATRAKAVHELAMA